VIPVRLQGVVLPGEKGIFPLQIAGVPQSLKVRLQTGPALSGTDLRDASGTIQFADFTNQIEYQNAGAALNRAMKNSVLEKLDRDTLPGKTVQVTGVFRLLNAGNWLITPVSLEVK